MTATGPENHPLPWPEVWEAALYGHDGFYRRPEGPAGHFRTASHAAGELLAAALERLALAAGCAAIVDVGAGRGELLCALAALPQGHGLRLHGVDVVDRPTGPPDGIGWSVGIDDLSQETLDGALVVCWELLDVVPCPVLELDENLVPRTVLVDPRTGIEHPGPPAPAEHRAWAQRWWPLQDPRPGDRVEVGLPREELWARLAQRVAVTDSGGLLLAVDYSHERSCRPAAGTLAGYRGGRLVPPVPDGSCDVTAHVALDAVATGTASLGGERVLTVQSEALRGLDVRGRARGVADASAGTSVGVPAAGSPDPLGVLAALQRAGRARELVDPDGLGGFGWLLQGLGRPVPAEIPGHRF
jgi:SAM-dependent MidA family methyltransferase